MCCSSTLGNQDFGEDPTANGAWVDSSDTAGVNVELTAAEVLPALC
jgi:hypothetical protein